ncbi:MAG: MMPL family transporter [Myxococcota bacterium]|nr:MMPL family transporter [Myxococcota bacterium]
MEALIPIDPIRFGVGSILIIALIISFACWRPSWIVRHARLVLTGVLLVSLGAVALIVRPAPLGLRIDIDPSSGPLLPVSDPGQEVYAEASLSFGSDDIYVVAMETDGMFTEENLTTLRRVTDEIRRLPGVRGAKSLVNSQVFRYDPDYEWVEIQELIEDIPSDPNELSKLSDEALQDPLFLKTMVSRDGKTAAINITFSAMDDAEFVGRDLDGRIRRILDAETDQETSFFIAGRPHVRAQAYHIMVGDLLRLVPLAVLVAAAVVFLITGSLRGTMLPLLNCLLATLWTFGAMVLVGKDMNLISMVLAPTLICVGSVYGVHVMSRYDYEAGSAPDPLTAALKTLEYMRVPVLMAGFTTTVGFGALMLADVRATNELGAFCSFGISCVTLLSLTGLPAALARLPLEEHTQGPEGVVYPNRPRLSSWLSRRIGEMLDAFGQMLTRRATRVLTLWGTLTVIALILIPRIVIDTDFLTFFNEDSKVRTDFREVNRLLTGAIPIYVIFDAEDSGFFRDPEMLRYLQRVQQKLEKQSGVSQVLSTIDFVTRANRALGNDDPEAERIPDSRMAVAEIMFMLPKEDTRRFQVSNHSSTNLVVRTGELGSRAIAALEKRILGVIAEEETPQGVRVDITGNTILINRSADGIAGSQASTVGMAALTIFALVCLVFRSVKVGVLSMAPNIVPVLIFFGTLGAGAAPLSVPTSLIGSITLGIAVDNTVHYVVSYLRQREAGATPNEAVMYGMHLVGRPIFVTSIMLMIGFSVITVSGFATLRQFGYLASITMGICMSTDLSLLPSLLVRTRP